LRNVGPIRHNEQSHANSTGVATVLSHAACASMSTTTTTTMTTTTRDRGDRYGPMEWAQWFCTRSSSVTYRDSAICEPLQAMLRAEFNLIRTHFRALQDSLQMVPFDQFAECILLVSYSVYWSKHSLHHFLYYWTTCTTPYFFIPHWSFSRIRMTGYYDAVGFQTAGSQDTDLILPISNFCCTLYVIKTHHNRRTDRQMDRRHASSISATCHYMIDM